MIYPIDHGTVYTKVLVYGETGSGKTKFAGSAADNPDMSEILFITCEGGELTVRGKNMMKTERVTKSSQVQNHLDCLIQQHPDYTRFRTVIVDSISAIKDMMLEEMLAEPGRKLEVPTKGEWGLLNTYIRRMTRHFIGLNMNVIFTCLPRWYYPKGKDENPGLDPLEVTPDFSRKLSNAVCAMFDSVWYLYTHGTKEEPNRRILLTQTQGIFFAKTRGEVFSEKLGQGVENPNLAKIHELLLNTGK